MYDHAFPTKQMKMKKILLFMAILPNQTFDYDYNGIIMIFMLRMMQEDTFPSKSNKNNKNTIIYGNICQIKRLIVIKIDYNENLL